MSILALLPVCVTSNTKRKLLIATMTMPQKTDKQLLRLYFTWSNHLSAQTALRSDASVHTRTTVTVRTSHLNTLDCHLFTGNHRVPKTQTGGWWAALPRLKHTVTELYIINTKCEVNTSRQRVCVCRTLDPGVEWECEFWGERMTGGRPLTGLDPLPPWNYTQHK